MPEAERLLLTHVSDVDHVGDMADDLEKVSLFSLLEHLFQFVTHIEVVFNGLLAAPSDDDDLVASGGNRLLDAVLNDGFVHQRQHFLGLGLGGGQETSA